MIRFYWKFILPIFSQLENHYFKNRLSYEDMSKVKDRIKHALKRLTTGITKPEDEIKQFKYISDRNFGRKLKRNFIPDLMTVFLRGGGDCSGLAWALYKFFIPTEKSCKLYMLIDKFKLRTSHVIAVWNSDCGLFICYNAGQIFTSDTLRGVFSMFAENNMVSIDGKPYKYSRNMRIYRWDMLPYRIYI